MSDWYAPNQQAVGIDPAAGEVTPTTAAGDGFDPADNTVADVQAYVTAHPDELEAVLQAETSGKNRSTLVDWLEAQSG